MADVKLEKDSPIHETALATAIDEAVTSGEEAAERLARQLKKAFSGTKRHRRDLEAYVKREDSGESASQVAAEYLQVTSALEHDANALLERQRATLGTFNIAFFGRTGTGKSSLMEALSRGSGRAISPEGLSDWTVEVRRVAWESCVLHDVPGINGWGRDRSRAELEEVARSAVETADLVVLAFDTQSQQAEEFRKIAAWVERYGKPVLAVLNCRNPLWRFGPRVPKLASRRQLSKAVQQHSTNIVEGLAGVGLHEVPVVAINTKRAVFACSQQPYEGPDATTFVKHRECYGVEALKEWSNLPALEQLLLAALKHDAVAIRLSMLHAQLRGAIDAALGDWSSTTARAADVIEDLERSIESILAVVGYPDGDDHDRDAAWKTLSKVRGKPGTTDRAVSMLPLLEELRGGRFDVPAEGDATRFARHKLAAALGTLRSKSVDQAMSAVEQAMARRELVSAEELQAAAFDVPAINDAVREIVAEFGTYLEERVGRAVADAAEDLKARVEMEREVDGRAGSTDRTFGRALGLGAIGGSATAALGTVALTNFWNPAGWTAAGALFATLAGAAISSVFGIFSKKARKAAERKRQEARSKARGHARRQINNAYDDMEKRVTERCAILSSETAREALERPLEVAIVLHRISQAAEASSRVFETVRDQMPVAEAATFALVRATRRVEAEGTIGRPAELWLGEGWLLQSAGDEPASPVGPTEQPDASLGPRLHDLWARIASSVPPTSGRRWLREAEAVLAADPDARIVLSKLAELAESDRPRIVVCGDYSSGKSSFIRRLLIEDFRRVPADLRIEAGPATDALREYGWGSATLIDTPGLQSGAAGHDEIAMGSLDAASALIYVFNPNLVVGRSEALELALRGDPDRRRAAKRVRTVYVINRADELGIDPEEDPGGYLRLCESKRSELVRALGRRNIEIQEDDVVCMASDPYGLIGDQEDPDPEDFERTRAWDGVKEFMDSARTQRAALTETGVDVAILEAGAASLTAVAADLRELETASLERHRQLNRLVRDLRTSVRRASALEQGARTQLVRTIDAHVSGLWQDALTSSGEERDALLDRLQKWHEDDELHAEVENWFAQTADDVVTWSAQANDPIDRRLRGAAFTHTFPILSDAVEVGFLSERRRGGKAGKAPAGAVGALGDKKTVLEAGHKLGMKFKPWGATKAASRFAKAGPILAAAQVGWDVWSFVRDERTATQRDERLVKISEELREAVDKAAEQIAFGTDEQPGPIAVLRQRADRVTRFADETRRRATAMKHDATAMAERAAAIDTVAVDAWSVLN